eukprot:SAG22_NODE_421_length_10720_cov_22.582619_3_plen_380_part_00
MMSTEIIWFHPRPESRGPSPASGVACPQCRAHGHQPPWLMQGAARRRRRLAAVRSQLRHGSGTSLWQTLSAGAPRKLIMDVDTGHDDAVAMLMAAASGRCELLGVCTVHGNTPVGTVTENTLRALESGGFSDVPVVEGAAAPLVTSSVAAPPTTVVQRRLLDCLPPSTGTTAAVPGVTAAQFLVDTIRSNKGVALVPTGPMTNIALALQLDPGIVDDVSEVVFMGGTISPLHQGGAEFNVKCDVVAAQQVLAAPWKRCVMVGLDVTADALLDKDEVASVNAVSTAAARAAHAVLADIDPAGWSAATQATGALEIYDACAVAAWLRPELLESTFCQLVVDDTGRTVCDFATQGCKRNCWAGTAINKEGFMRELLGTLRGE